MKRIVLFAFMVIAASVSFSQITYRTTASGNYTATTTWVGGAAATPPTSGVCNCKIVIATGHTITLDQSMTLTDANFALDGPNSVLTFSNNVDLTLNGTNSSIDIQNTTARIARGNPQNEIFFGTTRIYDAGSTAIPAGNPTGQVNGLVSASSRRASPQFQSGTLPVKLADFSATSKGTGVTISWKTDLEVNSSHFEIERSGEGREWASIASIQAAGNVSVQQNYSYTDAAPLDGANYYRLKIVDIDGEFEYSPVKSVNVAAIALNVVASPNPVSSLLNITVNQPGREPYRLRLINRAGQVVFDQKYAAANNRIQLNVSNYTDGSYFLETTNSAGLRQISKVMIVRN